MEENRFALNRIIEMLFSRTNHDQFFSNLLEDNDFPKVSVSISSDDADSLSVWDYCTGPMGFGSRDLVQTRTPMQPTLL